VASLTEVERALDAFFGVSGAGADPGFSRFIPATYDPIAFDWRAAFEPGFTSVFNGIMLRGAEQVSTVFCSVFPAAEVLDTFIAAARPGDLFFTHHPLDIESGDPRGRPGRGFLPIERSRIEAMRARGLSFYSCHAPLDIHPKVGTTAAMVEALGGRPVGRFWPFGTGHAGVICTVEPLIRDELITRLLTVFNLPYADVDGAHPAVIGRIAVVAGAGYKAGPMREAAAGGRAGVRLGRDPQPPRPRRLRPQASHGDHSLRRRDRQALIGVSHAASEHLVMRTQTPSWFTSRFGVGVVSIPPSVWWR
jgi:putative NIF3 family GTP cyclohydrolase 1 type 2